MHRLAASFLIPLGLLASGSRLPDSLDRFARAQASQPQRGEARGSETSPRVLLAIERSMTQEEWRREAPGMLVNAAEGGMARAVAHLLSRGVSPDSVAGPARSTALMRASRGGHTEVVRVLLAAGASRDATDRHGRTALGYAYEGDHPDAAATLLEADADPGARFAGERTVLGQAIADRRQPWVRLLGRYGATLSQEEGALLLNEAAGGAFGDDSGRGVIETLAGLGMSLDALAPGKPPALHTAITAARASLASALLAMGADPNGPGRGGERPLHVLARQVPRPNQAELSQLLIERGADLEAPDDAGARPLATAVVYGNLEIARSLLAAGAEVDNRDGAGRSALFLAAAGDRLPFVELLLAAGAGLDARGPGAVTPLHAALARPRLLVAPLLIERGADVGARDDRGATTLLVLAGNTLEIDTDWEATVERQLALARRLLESGVDPNAGDAEGRAPLDLAIRRQDAALADLLLGRGARLTSRGERALSRAWDSKPWREFLARHAGEGSLAPKARAAFAAAFAEVTSADRAAQWRTFLGIRQLGHCVMDWLRDHDTLLPAGAAEGLSASPSASVPGRRARLPADCAAEPQTDGWVRPFEFTLEMADELRILHVWLMSPGRDGEFSAAGESGGPFDPSQLDGDIVWKDGSLLRWPEWHEQ